MKDGVLAMFLNRCGNILMFLAEGLRLFTYGTKMLYQFFAINGTGCWVICLEYPGGDTFFMMYKIIEVEPEQSIAGELYNLLHIFQVNRVAIRSQAHHFVFISIMLKSEI